MIRLPVFPGSAFTSVRSRRGGLGSALLGICLLAAPNRLAWAAEPAASPPPPPAAVLESIQKATAAELVATMRDALAGTIKSGLPKPVDPTRPLPRKTRAFQAALAAAVSATDALAAGLEAREKSPELFQTMRRVGTSLAALQVAFRYRGAEDDETEDHFRTLAAAYGVFRRNFGRDLLAAKSEAEAALSAPQKLAFDTLKQRGLELTKQLTAIQPRVKDNPAAAFELEAVLNPLAEVEKARRDRRRLLNSLIEGELLLGRWAGTRLYVNTVYPGDAAKLAPADAAVAAFGTALEKAGDTVFTGTGLDAEVVFAQSASYAEDLGFERLPEPEVTSLLQSMRPPATPTSEPAGDTAQPTENTETADRAADRQINADDPDDDSSLDAGDDDDADGNATERAND